MPSSAVAKLGAGARADDVAADVLQERELLGARVEGDEIDLHGPFALAPDLARDLVGAAAARVLAVGDDQQIFPEDAGAIEVGPRLAQRVADRRAAARPRQARQRAPDRGAIVGLDRQPQRPDAARKAVDADLDGKVRALGDERVGGVEHRFERLLRDDVLGARIAGRVLPHRARTCRPGSRRRRPGPPRLRPDTGRPPPPPARSPPTGPQPVRRSDVNMARLDRVGRAPRAARGPGRPPNQPDTTSSTRRRAGRHANQRSQYRTQSNPSAEKQVLGPPNRARPQFFHLVYSRARAGSDSICWIFSSRKSCSQLSVDLCSQRRSRHDRAYVYLSRYTSSAVVSQPSHAEVRNAQSPDWWSSSGLGPVPERSVSAFNHRSPVSSRTRPARCCLASRSKPPAPR